MIRRNSLALLLPCHNEALALVHLLPKVPKYMDELMVIDNNSLNGTAKVAEFYGADIVYEAKRGYGSAFRTGFRWATEDIIVTMDGDCTYPLDDIERCVHFLLDNGLDFVSCSRFPLDDRQSMRRLNQTGNWILALVASVLFGQRITDITTGMWVFKRQVLDHIFPQCDDFTMCVEMKLRAMHHPAIRYGETHIGYHPRIGEVKQKWLRDGCKYLAYMLKWKVRR